MTLEGKAQTDPGEMLTQETELPGEADQREGNHGQRQQALRGAGTPGHGSGWPGHR